MQQPSSQLNALNRVGFSTLVILGYTYEDPVAFQGRRSTLKEALKFACPVPSNKPKGLY